MTVWVNLDYGGSGQGFGGYALDTYDKKVKDRVPHISLAVFITRCMQVLEVDEWAKLVGESCRVDADHSKVHRIGHFLKDQWFDPATELVALEEEK